MSVYEKNNCFIVFFVFYIYTGCLWWRTATAGKNKNTWNFAHKYIGRLWKILALIMLSLSAIAMLFVLGSDVDTVGTVGGIIVMIQLIPMVAAIFPTERALKNNFDEFGRKR